MQGATPLASPGLNPGGTGAGGRTTRPAGGAAIPVACRPCRSGIRRGGLPSLSPARPAFSFISFPYPPNPLPGGKGEIISSFRRGLRPRHPGGGSLRFGARGEESVAYRLSRAVRVQPRGCKGRSPLHEITLVSPSPEGKGRGMGAKHPSVFAGGSAPGTPEAGAYGSAQGGEESVAYRLAGAVRVQPRGCKGRSPLHEITLVSPSPTGKGQGDGGKTPPVFAGG